MGEQERIKSKVLEMVRQRAITLKAAGTIELDETYLGGPKKGDKRGRGTEKSLVQTALPLGREGRPEFFKMCVMDDLTSQTITEFVERHISEGSIIKTDEYSSYHAVFFGHGNYTHKPEKMDMKANPGHLSWLHQIIGNLKAFIIRKHRFILH